MFGKLSGREIKDIILAGKGANCSRIEYNGLVVTFGPQPPSKPQSATSGPNLTQTSDSPIVPQAELITSEITAEDELEHLKFTNPEAYENYIQEVRWNNPNKLS